MKYDRKTRLSRAVTAPPVDCGTAPPKIRSGHRYDVIGHLHSRGRIARRHLAIAEEIRSIHEAVGRSMFPTRPLMRPESTPRRWRPTSDFYDRMSETERSVWENHYLPWIRDLSTEVVAGMAGTRWLQLIVDIIIDNVPLREIETRYGLRHGTALSYLTNGLDRYRSGP